MDELNVEHDLIAGDFVSMTSPDGAQPGQSDYRMMATYVPEPSDHSKAEQDIAFAVELLESGVVAERVDLDHICLVHARSSLCYQV